MEDPLCSQIGSTSFEFTLRDTMTAMTLFFAFVLTLACSSIFMQLLENIANLSLLPSVRFY